MIALVREQRNPKTFFCDNPDGMTYDSQSVLNEHLHDFPARLPGGCYYEDRSHDSRIHRDIVDVDEGAGYSELFLNQNEAEFYEAIDQAIIEARVPDLFRGILYRLRTSIPPQGRHMEALNDLVYA